MKRASNLIVWAVLMFLLGAISGCSSEEPGIEIPLGKIWAWEMPGTKDIRTLEPKHFGPAVRQLPGQPQYDLVESSLWYQIYMAIDFSPEKQPVGPGFAVAGTEHKALAAVTEALKQNLKPLQTFPFGAEISLFFFTRDSGWPLHLKSVVKSGNTLTIRYYFVPHRSTGFIAGSSNRYFALIPLGKLPVGNYVVDMVQTMEKKYTGGDFQTVGKEFGEKCVCKSFAFTVVRDEEGSK